MGKKSIWLPGAPPTPLRIPNAVKAGPWVFASGTMGGPVGGGLAPEVRGNPALPLAGEAKGIRESRYILATLEAAFKAAGTSVTHGVWLNQFVTGRQHVDPYHEVRRDVVKPPRPASTTVAQPGLLAPDVTIQVDMVAIDPALAPPKEGITTDKIPQPLSGAGYSPAVRVGDHVFVAGQMATDFRTGVPPEAQVSAIFWEGSSIRRQTEFVLKNLALALEAAGRRRGAAVSALCLVLLSLYVLALVLPTHEFFELAVPNVAIAVVSVAGAALSVFTLWLTGDRFVPGRAGTLRS
jgi:enamine deaminase RidA (YjgF/YER057c/UK114 family)